MDGGDLSHESLACGAVDRDPLTLFDHHAVCTHLAPLQVKGHIAGAHHARHPELTGNYSRVAGGAPLTGENALGCQHAVYVVRLGEGVDDVCSTDDPDQAAVVIQHWQALDAPMGHDPGGFAEYARVPKLNVDRGVFPLPEKVSYLEGVFIEPLACVIRGQRKLGILPNETVLVLGSGVTGLLHIQLARNTAARVLATDINEFKLRAAERFGADAVIDAREDVPRIIREVNDGNYADCVIVSTAAVTAIKQSLKSVTDAGKILFFAPTPPGIEIPIDLNELWSRQITLDTTYAAAPVDISDALSLIETGRVKVEDMVTNRFGLEEINLGFKLVAESTVSLKVIVEPHK